MTRGFDSRRSWAAKMHQEWLAPAMAEYWDVDVDDIQPMMGDSAGAKAADQAGGIDAIVRTVGSAPVFVAQRVRSLRQHRSNIWRPDFSLREKTAGGDQAEYQRLIDAHRNGRDLPSTYLFGVGSSTSRPRCLKQGLDALFWIDTAELLDAIDARQIDSDVHRSRTGELTRYYSVDELRQAGCIDGEASGKTLNSVYGADDDVDPDFPQAESGVQMAQPRLQDFKTP